MPNSTGLFESRKGSSSSAVPQNTNVTSLGNAGARFDLAGRLVTKRKNNITDEHDTRHGNDLQTVSAASIVKWPSYSSLT